MGFKSYLNIFGLVGKASWLEDDSCWPPRYRLITDILIEILLIQLKTIVTYVKKDRQTDRQTSKVYI